VEYLIKIRALKPKQNVYFNRQHVVILTIQSLGQLTYSVDSSHLQNNKKKRMYPYFVVSKEETVSECLTN